MLQLFFQSTNERRPFLAFPPNPLQILRRSLSLCPFRSDTRMKGHCKNRPRRPSALPMVSAITMLLFRICWLLLPRHLRAAEVCMPLMLLFCTKQHRTEIDRLHRQTPIRPRRIRLAAGIILGLAEDVALLSPELRISQERIWPLNSPVENDQCDMSSLIFATHSEWEQYAGIPRKP